MLEPSYRQALGHALNLVWRHKILWVLGLLSVFVGEMGLSNFLGELWGKFVTPDNSWWPDSWNVLRITNGMQFFWFVWLVIIVVAIAAFVVIASVCAQAALIYCAQHWYRFHSVPKLPDAWHHGAKHFWSILAINVLEKFLLGVILTVVVSAAPLLANGFGNFIFTIILFAAAAFAAFWVSIISIYSLGYIVLDSAPVIEAVGRAAQLAHRHLLVSLELSAILLLCNVLVAWVISFGSLIVLIPSFLVSIVGAASGVGVLINFAVGLYMIFFVVFVMLLGAFFNSFTTGAWMYLFMKMHHEGLKSRLFHFVNVLRKKA